MNVLHGLFICFISAGLCGFNAAVDFFTGVEGRGTTVRCHFSLCGTKVRFCNERCEREDDVLIETTAGTAHKGRYSIEYEKAGKSCGVFVTIKQLIRSDAGRYSCRMSGWLGNIRQDINLTVKTAPTTTTSTSAMLPVTLSATTTQAADYSLPLIVCLSFSLIVVLVAVPLLIYKKKTRRTVDGLNTTVNLDYQNVTVESYEDCSDPTHEDSLYQSLDPASRDQDQIYCTLTKSK